MKVGKIFSIAMLNIAIAIINTIVFSPGLLGVEIGGDSIFQTALGSTVIIMSVLVFLIGNYRLLIEKKKVISTVEINTTIDCIEALEQNSGKKTFSKDIAVLLEQIQRLEKKKQIIIDLLLQKFNSSEMSYGKFQGVMNDIEDLFYLNIKSIINKLNIFDEEDYRQVSKANAQKDISKEFVQAKLNIYKEYISFIKDSVEDNEVILLKLDKLLLELSKFNSLEDGELETMMAMKEIDELINKAKYYKE